MAGNDDEQGAWWSGLPFALGYFLVFVPVFLAAWDVAAWRSPWVLSAIAAGVALLTMEWVLDRGARRVRKAEHARLGLLWAERNEDWKEHRYNLWSWGVGVAAAVLFLLNAGASQATLLQLALTGYFAVEWSLSAAQKWRGERRRGTDPDSVDPEPSAASPEALAT